MNAELREPRTAEVQGRRATPASYVVVGGLCGLAWATGLRGLMSELARSESTVSWSGTFLWILLPGIVCGALLGRAEHLRRTGGRRHWRWLALAPFAFTTVVFTPSGMEQLLGDGIGGGAIGIVLWGLAGGYALSGRGRLWARLASGLIALTPIPLWALLAAGAMAPPSPSTPPAVPGSPYTSTPTSPC